MLFYLNIINRHSTNKNVTIQYYKLNIINYILCNFLKHVRQSAGWPLQRSQYVVIFLALFAAYSLPFILEMRL